MTDSEIIELLQMQLKTQQQQNEFLQKTIEPYNTKLSLSNYKVNSYSYSKPYFGILNLSPEGALSFIIDKYKS